MGQPSQRFQFLPLFLFLILAATYIFLLSKPIILTVTDIGRHLINGREILNQNFSVLFENTYSYTLKDQSFVNHHWLAGVIFWSVYQAGNGLQNIQQGFLTLHLFHTALLVTFLALFFRYLQKKSSAGVSFLLSAFSLIFFSTRAEVRPETFGFIFLMIYLLLIQKIRKYHAIQPWQIAVITLTQLLWVNLHISFVFGIFVFWVFILLEKTVSRVLSASAQKRLLFTGALLCLVSLINPNGLQGFFSPFTIFQDYGYRVFENQNLWFLRSYYPGPIIPLFYLTALTVVAGFFTVPKIPLFEKTLALTGIFLGWTALRNIPIFVIFSFPLLAIAFQYWFRSLRKKIALSQPLLTYSLVLSVPILLLWGFIKTEPFFGKDKNSNLTFGLVSEQQQTLDFLKKIPQEAKIFNNYDIGGALIFSLFPQNTVFVDNRPEAYSSSFFQDLYIPMQNSETTWEKAEETFDFTYIIFGHRDITPWAQSFLKNRLRDPQWKTVYLDPFIIVFAKDVPENKDFIDTYSKEVPLSRLKI